METFINNVRDFYLKSVGWALRHTLLPLTVDSSSNHTCSRKYYCSQHLTVGDRGATFEECTTRTVLWIKIPRERYVLNPSFASNSQCTNGLLKTRCAFIKRRKKRGKVHWMVYSEHCHQRWIDPASGWFFIQFNLFGSYLLLPCGMGIY